MERVTDHYVFHYVENSIAERDISQISSLQEGCYSFISNCLGTDAHGKIHYHLFDTPEEVGKQYAIINDDDDDEPCNGFALPDTMSKDGMNHIYAVYNEKVKCIGFHEDAHIISYSYGRPGLKFIREGLAMSFDHYWWGIDNYTWVRWYLEEGKMPSVEALLENEYFCEFDDTVVYPIAGAFTSYLIQRFGMNKYVEFYKTCVNSGQNAFKAVFGVPVPAIEKEFIDYIKMFRLRKEVRELIIKYLEG